MTNIVCEGGVCRLVDAGAAVAADAPAAAEAARTALGLMDVPTFLAFLSGADAAPALPGSAVLLPLFAVFAGLAMNLTPCVLPMVPVNLIVIGRSWRRGVLYAAGMALAYGSLGLAVALGGAAFGSIQGGAWFNGAVAAVFAALSLSLFGAFSIDLSRWRSRLAAPGRAFVPLFMGALSATLAGACVAPVLVAVLVLSAGMYARGNAAALALPFLVGAGMGLPWPFLAAGFRLLPKPGPWMRHVNRVFGAAMLALAAWYAALAFRAATAPDVPPADGGEATPATISARLAEAKRPVLVDCFASWCKNCSAMERTTLADPEVRRALERFTVIRLRAEDIDALRRTPGFGSVSGLPAYLVFE